MTANKDAYVFDVLIVGAGMVGSAIACGLAQAGMKVGIIDSHAPKAYGEVEHPRIRVSALSYASEQLLRNLGAWPFIAQTHICQYRRLAVNELPAKEGISAKLPDISKWARTEFCAEEVGFSHLGHIIENDLVQIGLHQAMDSFDSIQLFCPENIDHWDLSGDIKQLSLASGRLLKAPLVIGADGAQSQVRINAGIGQFREQYEQSAFVSTVAYRGSQEDITWQAFTPHGPIAFLPLAEREGVQYASLVWYDSPEKIAELKALDRTELLRFFQQQYPSTLPALEAVIETASFPLYKSHAKRYVCPGVVLAGDAAHTINPLAGQGVNLGFMDAAVLIETLAQARLEGENLASLKVLKRYEQNRRIENQAMMSLMDMFYYSFSNDHLPLRVLRNVGLGLANNLGLAKNKVMKYAMGASGKLPKLARPA